MSIHVERQNEHQGIGRKGAHSLHAGPGHPGRSSRWGEYCTKTKRPSRPLSLCVVNEILQAYVRRQLLSQQTLLLRSKRPRRRTIYLYQQSAARDTNFRSSSELCTDRSSPRSTGAALPNMAPLAPAPPSFGTRQASSLGRLDAAIHPSPRSPCQPHKVVSTQLAIHHHLPLVCLTRSSRPIYP